MPWQEKVVNPHIHQLLADAKAMDDLPPGGPWERVWKAYVAKMLNLAAPDVIMPKVDEIATLEDPHVKGVAKLLRPWGALPPSQLLLSLQHRDSD